MNVRKILIELKAERHRLNRAIAALEKLVPQKRSRPISGERTMRPLPNASTEKRGRLLVFRKPAARARAKASRAEEA